MKSLISDVERFETWLHGNELRSYDARQDVYQTTVLTHAVFGLSSHEVADLLAAECLPHHHVLSQIIAKLRHDPIQIAERKYFFILWDLTTNGEPLSCVTRSRDEDEVWNRVQRIIGTKDERDLVEAREKQKWAQRAYIEACKVMEGARKKLAAADKRLAKLTAVKP